MCPVILATCFSSESEMVLVFVSLCRLVTSDTTNPASLHSELLCFKDASEVRECF